MIENIDKMNGWSIEELPNLVFFQEGPGVRNNQYTDSGVKLLNVANLKDGNVYLDNTDRYISEEEAYGKYSHFLVDEGDLIIASSGIKVEYFDKKMGFAKKEHLPLCMNTSTIRFKTLDDNILNIEYFAYFLKTNYFKKQISRLITGSAQLNFGPSHLKQIKIILPPIEVQKKIVEVLDKAQELIDKRKEQMEALDELVKSRFIEMFGDPVKNPKKFPIHSLMNCYDRNDAIKCGPFGSALKKHEYTDKGIPVWNMDNIHKNGNFYDKPNLWITNEKYELLKNYETKNGDIIISRAGTVGKMTVVNSVYNKSIISTNLIRLRLNEKILPMYFTMLINIFRNKVCRLQTGSDGAFTHMNTGVLNSIEIPIPPIELQNQFADFVNQVDSLKSQMETSLKELEDNFNSLMQKAFKGELF